jgi:CMP/dCMP kinase
MSKGFVIAIDGPVASGKGTVAKFLVDKLRAATFYSGGMYRALALACIQKGIDMENENEVVEVARHLAIELKDEKKPGMYSTVYIDGKNVNDRIMQTDAANGASTVGRYKEARAILVKKQQEFAQKALDEGKIIVMEGRDIGTVVFPNADFKLYLTANVETRAERRRQQYNKMGTEKSLEEVVDEIKARDYQDMNREESPLPSNPSDLGYFLLDNSTMTEASTIDQILKELEKKGICQNG